MKLHTTTKIILIVTITITVLAVTTYVLDVINGNVYAEDSFVYSDTINDRGDEIYEITPEDFTSQDKTSQEENGKSGVEVKNASSKDAGPQERSVDRAESEQDQEVWRVTEFCERCNSCGSHETASGRYAEEWYSCAVSHDNYRKLKGKEIHVEGFGTFRVDDWGTPPSNCDPDKWIDLYLDTELHNRVCEKAEVTIYE